MKILLLANPDEPHTHKWVTYLCNKGIEIYLFGLNEFDRSLYQNVSNLTIHTCGFTREYIMSSTGHIKKMLYIKVLPALKKAIRQFKPNILHSHYASGYGLIGALAGFHPYVVSVWGGDVYMFPKKSFLHRWVFKFNLSRADKVLSTSKVMKEEIMKYTNKEISVLPFGIDLEKFRPLKGSSDDSLVVGTVKQLKKKYGVDYLIRSFHEVKKRNPGRTVKLMIVGDGKERGALQELIKDLDMTEACEFAGRVPPDKVPEYLNKFDIYVALSIYDSESFGVAVLEASACELPVVVSDVDGFQEVVSHEQTGIIVPRENPQRAADAIQKLLEDQSLRFEMGRNGREFVKNNFDLTDNLEKMLAVYKEISS
jgi:glycosyltransferase involved in cell wall biosynthesis